MNRAIDRGRITSMSGPARVKQKVDRLLGDDTAQSSRLDPSAGGSLREDVVLRGLQMEARGAQVDAQFADRARSVAASRSSQAAHALVGESARWAAVAAARVEGARVILREVHGQARRAAERAFALVAASAARAGDRARETRRAFERRFGRYAPRGVTAGNQRRVP